MDGLNGFLLSHGWIEFFNTILRDHKWINGLFLTHPL